MPTSPSMKTLTTFWTSTTCQISLSHPPSLLPSLRMRSLTRETSENEAKTRRRNARRRESFQLLPAQRTMRRLSTTVPRKICSWSCTCVSLCILSNIYTIGNPEIQRQERADLCSGRSLESGHFTPCRFLSGCLLKHPTASVSLRGCFLLLTKLPGRGIMIKSHSD
jgi:hypothetical protein